MKKNILLLIIPCFFMVGCGGTTTSTSTPSNEASPSIVEELSTSQEESVEISETTQSSVSEEDSTEYVSLDEHIALFNESKVVSNYKLTFSVKKDDVSYYDLYELFKYDETNKTQYFLSQVTQISSLSQDGGTTLSKTEVYYDKYNTYTLDGDGMYIKGDNNTTLGFYTLKFDFSKIEKGFLTKESYFTVLNATINKDNINAFYNKELSNVESINLKAYEANNAISKIILNYVQDGFDVVYTIEFSKQEITVSLPTSNYIKEN